MKSLKKFKHITDLIHFESVDAKITEEVKKYYLVMDAGGRANYLHFFEYGDKLDRKIFSFCGEYEEWEEEKDNSQLYSETELKIYITGNPHYTYCGKCIQNFNKRKR